MEIISYTVNKQFNSEAIDVSILSYNINYVIFAIKLQNESIHNHKEYIVNIQDKIILFELLNDSLLWNLVFETNKFNSNNYSIFFNS